MKSRILWSLALSALLLSPTVVQAQTWALGAPGSTQFYVNGQTGLAYVKNTTPNTAAFMLALMDATNPNNQMDLGSRSTITLAPGADAYISVGLSVPRCTSIPVQPDVWINPPPVGGNGRYTLGELTLYGGGSIRTESGPQEGCTTTPQPPPPCVPLVMQQAFSINDWIMSIPDTMQPSGVRGVWPYPYYVGPLALNTTIPAGTFRFTSKTKDYYHKLYPDDTPINEHEQLYYVFLPSMKTTAITQDIPSDVNDIVSDIGTVTFAEAQTHVYVVHAPRLIIDDVARDSLLAEWLRWERLCVAGGQ